MNKFMKNKDLDVLDDVQEFSSDFKDEANKFLKLNKLANHINIWNKGNRIRHLVNIVANAYKDKPEDLKKFFYEDSDFFKLVEKYAEYKLKDSKKNIFLPGEFARSAYMMLTQDFSPLDDSEFAGLGITLNTSPLGLKLNFGQFCQARLSGDALSFSVNKKYSLQNSINSGNALYNSVNEEGSLFFSINSGNSLHNSKNSENSLQYSKNSGNSLQNSKNIENSLHDSENSEKSLQNSKNSGQSLQFSKNSGNSLQNSKNIENSLVFSNNSDNSLEDSKNSGQSLQYSKNSGYSLHNSKNSGQSFSNSYNSGHSLHNSKNSENSLCLSKNSEESLQKSRNYNDALDYSINSGKVLQIFKNKNKTLMDLKNNVAFNLENYDHTINITYISNSSLKKLQNNSFLKRILKQNI
jgi:hypothetical protein